MSVVSPDTIPDSHRSGINQWRAGYYFSGGASELSTNMRPYNVTLDKRGPKARAERRRCEVFLGGSGAQNKAHRRSTRVTAATP